MLLSPIMAYNDAEIKKSYFPYFGFYVSDHPVYRMHRLAGGKENQRQARYSGLRRNGA